MKLSRLVAFAALLFAAASAAHAHFPVPSDPFKRQGCTAGLTDLANSWAILGALLTPHQLDYICFNATPDDEIKAAIVIPPKAAYQGPNDVTMLLTGPGLPPIGLAPFDPLPMGAGGIAQTIDPTQGPFPKRNYLGWWYGGLIDVHPPTTGEYEIRVYSPSNWQGEYILTTTGNDPNSASNNLADTKLPTPGDLNQDGVLDMSDVNRALIIALGVEPPNDSFELSAGDVAPPGDVDQLLIPGDGVIDLSDVTRILRRVMGLDTSEDWPD